MYRMRLTQDGDQPHDFVAAGTEDIYGAITAKLRSDARLAKTLVWTGTNWWTVGYAVVDGKRVAHLLAACEQWWKRAQEHGQVITQETAHVE